MKCLAFRELALTGNPVHSGILPSLPDDLSYNHFQDTSRHLDEPAMLPQSPLSYANTVYAVLWDDLLMFDLGKVFELQHLGHTQDPA